MEEERDAALQALEACRVELQEVKEASSLDQARMQQERENKVNQMSQRALIRALTLTLIAGTADKRELTEGPGGNGCIGE